MKATLPDGTQFEGTPEEYILIRNAVNTKANGYNPMTVKMPTATGMWDERKARHFWDSLDIRHGGGRQKGLLKFLISDNGRTTEKELQDHMGIKGQKLAGVLANLSRNARRETEDGKVKVVVRIYDAKGGRVYYIPDDILQYLKKF